MLFKVEMTVNLPTDMDKSDAAKILAEEKAYAQNLMREGKWRHLWRIVGEYKNISIFDVNNNAELHDTLSKLPLFPYMDIQVTALCKHPSSIREDDT